MIFFGKKEKTRICDKCGSTYTGLADSFEYCGGCLERIRDRTDGENALKMTKALKKRGDWFKKSEGL